MKRLACNLSRDGWAVRISMLMLTCSSSSWRTARTGRTDYSTKAQRASEATGEASAYLLVRERRWGVLQGGRAVVVMMHAAHRWAVRKQLTLLETQRRVSGERWRRVRT